MAQQQPFVRCGSLGVVAAEWAHRDACCQRIPCQGHVVDRIKQAQHKVQASLAPDAGRFRSVRRRTDLLRASEYLVKALWSPTDALMSTGSYGTR
jgi:hypothetical protein